MFDILYIHIYIYVYIQLRKFKNFIEVGKKYVSGPKEI